jgi:hypothetical protein
MSMDFTAEKEMEEEIEKQKKQAKTKSLTEIVDDHKTKKLITQDFDRFDHNFVSAYMEDIK